MVTKARAVAFVCVAEILGLTGFSLVPALLPQFIATWSLSNTKAGWLAGMMSGGYTIGEPRRMHPRERPSKRRRQQAFRGR
jgi:hypothetical protein